MTTNSLFAPAALIILTGTALVAVPTTQEPQATSERGRGWSAPSRLQLDTEALRRQRQRTRPDVSDVLRNFDEQPVQSTALDSLREHMKTGRQRRRGTYEDIARRLDELERLLRTPPPAVPVPVMRVPEDSGESKVQEPTDLETADPTQIPPPLTGNPPDDPQQPQDAADPVADDPEVPEIRTETAVDRLALADNLFASERFDLARKFYLELEQTERDPGKQEWIKYQVATSSRRLGDAVTTEKYLRKLAGSKSGGLYPRLARWWLDALNKRMKYEADLQKLKAIFQIPETDDAPGQP